MPRKIFHTITFVLSVLLIVMGAVCEALGALFNGGSEDEPAGKINLRINSTDEIESAIEHGDGTAVGMGSGEHFR